MVLKIMKNGEIFPDLEFYKKFRRDIDSLVCRAINYAYNLKTVRLSTTMDNNMHPKRRQR